MKKEKESTELAVSATSDQLDLLRQEYPVEQGFTRTLLPRLGMYSQDKTVGKGKAMQVVSEAGMFYIEHPTNTEDERGKKVWEKEEIDASLEAVILYQRKQLSFYDQPNNTFTSSPVYDADDEVIPLFCNKTEVDRGTPKELKERAIYQGLSAKGKPTSKLKDNKILYVLYAGEVYQLSLSGTSMFSFMKYARKTLVPSVLTRFGSEAQVNGATEWNMMTFDAIRPLTREEIAEVIMHVQQIKEGILSEKQYYASHTPTPVSAHLDLEATKQLQEF